MSTTPRTLTSGRLKITYSVVPGLIPFVHAVKFDGGDLASLISAGINSTLIGTCKYHPYRERVSLDPSYQKLACEIFNEISNLHVTHPDLEVACADFFFNHSCGLYWSLITNTGSKNLACASLEETCLMVNRWESKYRKRVHKGTPYYFLTFAYREMGDIDSAFASAFKAIREDEKSIDPILGAGAYRNSPAYKYVTIVDDLNNYLYDVVLQLRRMLEGYITKFKMQSF